jgi:large subunit ribosomal protein L4
MADQPTTFDAAAYTALGTARERVTLPAAVFDGTVNTPVMHLAVKAYLANQRQATASTKTRRWVIGGNQKPWKQKGTGRARQGSTRAPHWPGGGTVFGPHGDRNYEQTLPRQVKRLARKSAFNARAREQSIFVVDNFNYAEPKTKTLQGLLDRVGVGDQKVLVLTDGVKPNVYLSGRNLSKVHVMPFGDASTYHILWSDAVLIEGAAIGQSLTPVAEKLAPVVKAARPAKAAKPAKGEKPAKDAAPAKARARSAPAKKKAAPAKAAAMEPAAKKTARATTAKKPAAKKSAPKRKGK